MLYNMVIYRKQQCQPACKGGGEAGERQRLHGKEPERVQRRGSAGPAVQRGRGVREVLLHGRGPGVHHGIGHGLCAQRKYPGSGRTDHRQQARVQGDLREPN